MWQGGDETSLQRTVSRALGLLGLYEAARRAPVSQSLSDAGGIDLPDLDEPEPSTRDPALLAPMGPLYMAHELERAGFLRAAELIAGLFASGAIQLPLGPTARLLNDFWRARHERLTETERSELLEHAFEAHAFYPRMERLCAALERLADNIDASDIHEAVGLETAGWALVDLLGTRVGGMLAFAAGDILQSIKAALAFMRDRPLQAAFGVRDMWSLVATAGVERGIDVGIVRAHVDLARDGASVLVWLAGAAAGGMRLDPAAPQAKDVIGAAVRWRLARQSLPAESIGTSAPRRILPSP